MTNVDTILFPVDLSEASPSLVPWVRVVAEKFGAKVHVLFVARVMDYYAGLYVPHPSIANFEAEIVQGAEKKLSEFVTEHMAGLNVKALVRPGYPAEEILLYAESQTVDMIIIGTHGRKGLERIIFGSVAEHVVKHSKVPVMTVNPYRK
ncbi:MAG: universal stress protein [Pseudomonadota bacterium]